MLQRREKKVATELASAYVTLIPSLKGAQKTIEKELGGVNTQGAGQKIGSGLASGVSTGLKAITAAAGVAATALAGVTLVKGWDRLVGIDSARAKLSALGHDAKSVEGIMDSALGSVKGTAYGLDEAATAAASAVAAGVQPGQELTKYLATVGDAAAISGRSMTEMGSIFGKVQTSGRASMLELNQLADSGIPIYQYLADEIGVTTDEVRKMASEGQISSEMFLNAIEKNIGGAAKIMGETSFSGALSNIGASISRIGANFLDAGGQGGGFFSQLKPLMVDFMGILEKVEGLASNLGVSFGAAFSDFVGHMEPAVSALNSFLDGNISLSEMLSAVTTTVVSGIANMLPGVIEAAANVFTGLVTGLGQALPSIISAIVSVLPSLIDSIVSVLPALIEGAIQLFLGLVTGLVQALPQIIDAIVNAIPQLIEAILSMLPLLIEGAIQLFLGLALGLVQALPQIIDTVINAIPQIAQALIAAAPQIFQAGIKLFMELAKAVPQILGSLVTAIGSLVQGGIRSIGGFVGQMAQAGLDLIMGLVRGIQNAAGAVADAVTGAVGGAINAAKNLLGIASPSKVFAEIGMFTAEGLAIGIAKNAREAIRSTSDMVSGMVDAAKNADIEVPVAPSFVSNGYLAGDIAARGSQGDSELLDVVFALYNNLGYIIKENAPTRVELVKNREFARAVNEVTA